jgi:hypothetical protein
LELAAELPTLANPCSIRREAPAAAEPGAAPQEAVCDIPDRYQVSQCCIITYAKAFYLLFQYRSGKLLMF